MHGDRVRLERRGAQTPNPNFPTSSADRVCEQELDLAPSPVKVTALWLLPLVPNGLKCFLFRVNGSRSCPASRVAPSSELGHRVLWSQPYSPAARSMQRGPSVSI